MKFEESQQPLPSLKQFIRLLNAAKYMGEEKNLDKLLSYIAKQCIEAMDVDRCSIFLLDEKKGEIWSKVQLGEEREIRFSAGLGIAGQVIRTNKACIINDATRRVF